MKTIAPSACPEDAQPRRRPRTPAGNRPAAQRARSAGFWYVSLLLAALLLAACGGGNNAAERESEAAAAEPTVTSPESEPAESSGADEAAAEEEADTISGDASAGEGEASSSAFESPLQAESPLEVPPLSPLPTPPTPSEESSVFIGRVVSTQMNNQPMVDTVIRLGLIDWDEDREDGTFVISGSEGYGTYTEEDGTFIIEDVEPGDYVVLVGDMIGYNEVVTESDGEARVFNAEAGEVVDSGTLIVDLPEH